MSEPARGAAMRRVCTGLARETLSMRLPDLCLWGKVEVTDFEIKTYCTKEGTFVALLNAYLTATLDDMAQQLIAPTLPVHDEPLEAR